MKGDFSRDTFRPELQYTRVLAQQGRVDLDADRNEVQALLLERMRLAIMDHFGPFSGPKYLYDPAASWGRENDGFQVGVEPDGANIKALTIGAGRYYVEGWACATAVMRYAEDKDQPLLPVFPEELLTSVPFFVYLDVWERHRTSLEDEFIRELALNGIDTASRAQLVCQVRFIEPADLPAGPPVLADYRTDNLKDWWPKILERLRGVNPARLKVLAERPQDASDNPCLAAPQARYIGPENHLYRVEIHNVDKYGKATFKFSRNNGSDVAALEEINSKFLRIGGVYEPWRGFSAGQWVELTDDERELLGQPGTLVKVIKVEGKELTIDPASANGTLDPNEFKTYPKVRRWDQTERGPLKLEGGAIEVKQGLSIPLEYGIHVEFEDGAIPHTYRPSDYWTFPARYLSGDVAWPKDTFLPPHGVIHSYAPLAAVKAAGNVVDLRVLKDRWS
jgi:hypothetical protein